MNYSTLTTTNVGGVDVIEIPSPSTSTSSEVDVTQPSNTIHPDFLRILIETVKAARNAKRAINSIQSASELDTLQKAKKSFKRIAVLALTEMGYVCQMMSTIRMCVAKYFVNRRLIFMINGYIRMIKAHEPFVDGEYLWTLEEARDAVYVIAQIQRGFHLLLLTAKGIKDTPDHKIEQLGKDLQKKYLAIWGNRL